MTLAETRERQRRAVLARLAAMQDQNARSHDDAEQRASAAFLGCVDHLPEPQDDLELPSAA